MKGGANGVEDGGAANGGMNNGGGGSGASNGGHSAAGGVEGGGAANGGTNNGGGGSGVGNGSHSAAGEGPIGGGEPGVAGGAGGEGGGAAGLQGIAFNSDRALEGVAGSAGTKRIWIMAPDGSNPVNLTEMPSGTPRISPDGSKILFESAEGDHDVWVMDVDGQNRVNLTAGSDVNDGQASWSTDGSAIVFVSRRDQSAGDYLHLFRMDAHGSNVVQLIGGPSQEFYPAWAGDLIAYETDYDDGSDSGFNIWVKHYDADLGVRGVNLTSDNSEDDSDPLFSPDGTRIAYVGRDGSGTNDTEVFVMNVDGSSRVQVTDNDIDEQQPTWSPDGARLAFQRDGDIWVVDVNGNGEVNITPNTDTSTEAFPSWGNLAE